MPVSTLEHIYSHVQDSAVFSGLVYSLKITPICVMKNVIKDTFQTEAAPGHAAVNSYISFAKHSSNP